MSAEAVGHVYRCSPYRGATFAVHHAVADSVNDQHGNEFWMSAASLAEKARMERRQVGRALAVLVEDGWLDLLIEGGGRGKTACYRFVFRDEATVVFDSRKPRQGVAVRRNESATRATETATSTTDTATSTPPYKENPREPKRTQAARSARTGAATPPKPKARNLIWDALVQVHGEPTTKGESSRIGKAAAEHKRIGSTPEQIIERSREAWRRWGGQPFGPEAVLKWWGSLAEPAPSRTTSARGSITEAFDEIERRLAGDVRGMARSRGPVVRVLPAAGSNDGAGG